MTQAKEEYPNLYCLRCDKHYNAKDSSANEPIMFCSKECEAEENERLIEGNKIIKMAILADPIAGIQMGIMTAEREKAIEDIVDKAFLNMKNLPKVD